MHYWRRTHSSVHCWAVLPQCSCHSVTWGVEIIKNSKENEYKAASYEEWKANQTHLDVSGTLWDGMMRLEKRRVFLRALHIV